MRKTRRIAASAVATGALALALLATPAGAHGTGGHQQAYGGPGPMMGQPGMMGPGMMGQMGPGMMMGPMMGGQGGMMGPGTMMGPMMGQPGMMGPGMTGQMGPGMMMGPMMGGQGGMMGPMMGQPGAMAPCPGMQQGQQQGRDLSADDVRGFLERWIAMQGNPRLAVGSVEEKDEDTIVADIVTKEGGVLVDRFEIDRHTGAMRRAG